MSSFLICANSDKKDVSFLLNKACAITKKLTPSLGAEIKHKINLVPEINGGYFYVFPFEGNYEALVSEYLNDSVAILVFGSILHPSKNPAEYVYDAWKQDRIDAVRKIDGCFSAVIIDINAHSIHIASDIVGLRTLHYYHDNQALLVSTQDIPIVATGLCPVDFNLQSACSIISFDWSLKGTPLIEKINACDPNEYLTYYNGKLKHNRKPLLATNNRIDPKDHVSRNNQIDRIINKMQEKTRTICENKTLIKTDLTAGIDSRASLGILLSVTDPRRIKAVTTGTDNSIEVKTARKIAKLYNVNHTNNILQKGNVKEFIQHSKLLAFCTNGQTNSKRATTPLPNPEPNRPPRFSGNGGEIYDGFYYPNSFTKPPLANYSSHDAIKHLEKRFPRINTLPWTSPEFPEKLRLNLAAIINSYNDISSHPADLLDLFYLYERYCRWGSSNFREFWKTNNNCIFGTPATVKLAYELPAPISNDHLLHRTIIKRFLKHAYYLPVNRGSFLPLSKYPKIYDLLGKRIRGSIGLVKKYKRILGFSIKPKSASPIIANIFASDLAEMVTDITMSNNSIACEILQRKELEKILYDHISGQKDYLQLLGFLVTIEQYKYLVLEAKKLAEKPSNIILD